MNEVYNKLMTCVESIKKKIDFQPEVAVILKKIVAAVMETE